MGSCKIDSSAVYTLCEELKHKIDELGKNVTSNDQTDSTFDIDEIISLIEDLKVQFNQQQFSPEQIKNLGQISAYSIGKVNKSLSKAFFFYANLSTIKPLTAHFLLHCCRTKMISISSFPFSVMLYWYCLGCVPDISTLKIKSSLSSSFKRLLSIWSDMVGKICFNFPY